MRGNRVDGNSAEIVDALRKAGALWIPTSGDPKIAFDGICCFHSRIYLVEIKDGSKPPSARRLTPAEQERQIQLKQSGVNLRIWESPEDALKDIGATA